MDLEFLTTASDAELTDYVGQAHAIECLVHRARLAAIAELDRRHAYRHDGAKSTTQWLQTTLSTSHGTAQEEVRIATALEDHPKLGDLYGNGEISWDQLKPALRIAAVQGEDDIIEVAPHRSVGSLERQARRCERMSLEQARTAREQRGMQWRRDNVQGTMRIGVDVPIHDGEAAIKSLHRIAEDMPVNPETGRQDPYPQRMADAFLEVAKTSLRADPDTDRATIVCHTELDTLLGVKVGLCELEDGTQLALQTVQRLLCSGRIEYAIVGPNGQTIGIRRASRTIPAPILRQLKHRDGGCRLCGRTWATQGHHIIAWIPDGETNLDNLILLCTGCHWRMHEGGWNIQVRPDGEFWFIRPDGTRHLGPPKIRDHICGRLLGLAGAYDDTS